MVNGEIVAQGSQSSLEDVEVVTATVDPEEVRAYRVAHLVVSRRRRHHKLVLRGVKGVVDIHVRVMAANTVGEILGPLLSLLAALVAFAHESMPPDRGTR